MFYHDQKEHASPSALDQWLRSRAAFIQSYFEGKKGPETAAMKFGTQVHALIEHGLLKVKKHFDQNEQGLRYEAGQGLYVFGKPDSYQSKPVKNTVEFVDYKTGKASEWAKKLPTDIKMKVTAWLVWQATGCPAAVIGHIEFLQTTWNEEKQSLELLSEETEITSITYHKADLEAFTEVIIRTMGDINTFYETWKDRTTDYVDQADCERLAELTKKADEIDEEIKSLKASITSQMEFGGLTSHKIEGIGTISISTKATYSIPNDLPFQVGKKKYTLEDFAAIEMASKAAVKNYQLVSEPVSTTTSTSFRAAK